eukprot:TRINITY_DN12_c0_g4_i1.p1 TRINITY_DN12_c0_g4~~TRINITY_DN12_c0_g4_i1.p1  ORF type:complete len:133 (+),score=39.98 TRINITY_DN12_c0_g4_i1:55-453(+)
MSDPITVKAIDISPNHCPLEKELNLTIDFETAKDIAQAKWELKYVVDYSGKQYVIELGKSNPGSYKKGSHKFSFSVAAIDVSTVKKSVLSNVGILSATLYDGAEEIIAINMVSDVTKTREGVLQRNIFSPLE